MTRRWLAFIALSCLPQFSAAQGRATEAQPGMVITGDREAPLVLYIVPWQEPKAVAPPQLPLLPLVPVVVDRSRSVLDEPANRPLGLPPKSPAAR